MIEQMNHPQGKTSELVERLRKVFGGREGNLEPAGSLLNQAASELTRLEEENGKLREGVVFQRGGVGRVKASRDMVLAALTAAKDKASRAESLNVEAVGGLREIVAAVTPEQCDALTWLKLNSLLSRLQSGSENKGLAGVPGDWAGASGVFSPESEAGDSAPHHTKGGA